VLLQSFRSIQQSHNDDIEENVDRDDSFYKEDKEVKEYREDKVKKEKDFKQEKEELGEKEEKNDKEKKEEKEDNFKLINAPIQQKKKTFKKPPQLFLKDLVSFDDNIKRFKIKVKPKDKKKSRSFLEVKKEDLTDMSKYYFYYYNLKLY